jgi:hypothetical protein
MSTRFKFKTDADGDETLLPLFVMAASVLVAIIVLSGAIGSMLARNTPTAYWEYAEGYELIGGVQYSYIAPTKGYNVTEANHTNDVEDDDASQKLQFTYGSWDYFTIRLIHNVDKMKVAENFEEMTKYRDFVAIHVKASQSSTSTADKWRAISYDKILSNTIMGNTSFGYLTIFKTNFTIILTTNGTNEGEHHNLVWAGQYNIRVAVNTDIAGSAEMNASMWTILGQILTLQLPDVSPTVNLLLAVPIWAAMGFMVFTIFSRVIPFISGG